MDIVYRESPRSFALVNGSHCLSFRYSHGSEQTPKCIVEFSGAWDEKQRTGYKAISRSKIHGCLGIINIEEDVFLCVISATSKVAEMRPGETVNRILAAEFHCLSRDIWDSELYAINTSSTENLDEQGNERNQQAVEHPCHALRKLLSGGSFYFSNDFDLTNRMQERTRESQIDLEVIDEGFMWNSYMMSELLLFRSRLRTGDRAEFDKSQFLTIAIRGFVETKQTSVGPRPASLTVLSRLSCRRAGTRFLSRGVDDEGSVANFVETETIITTKDWCWSYAQIRGSVPVFFEQTGIQLIAKITLSRSLEATQPSFDKHFQTILRQYGQIHVVNLLGVKPGEQDLTDRYHQLAAQLVPDLRENVRLTDYDFHQETRSGGYEQAHTIRPRINADAESFGFFLEDLGRISVKARQSGVFRTNCLDCLDRTNVIQGIISQILIELFAKQKGLTVGPDFWLRHATIWADNGDSLSKIYTGTGAIKSSFTRSGKTSFAGAVADLTKNVGRAYINNFADKGRQNTIDMLLGRLLGQSRVQLFDPINDWVMVQMNKRLREYSQTKQIRLFVGTYNLNGKLSNDDLSAWLFPPEMAELPDIFVVGFQEIVELTPSQIMSTDPGKRMLWEGVIQETLDAKMAGLGPRNRQSYTLLRSGQLVGTALMIFVSGDSLNMIRNVEGANKKTGLHGMSGNKGAVAIRLDYASTSMCFVTAHLAAGHANYLERNDDYHTISNGLEFGRRRGIIDHETVVWLGDFNYRIGIANEQARALIAAHDLDGMYEMDQLNLQMIAGKTFPYYSESQIDFLPTYKFDNNTDRYDSSEKQRIPAWTDRILRRGKNVSVLVSHVNDSCDSWHMEVQA